MTDNVILGLPFIGMIYPFTTDNIGITTKHLGKEIIFKFLKAPEKQELKQLTLMHQKTQQLKYLQEEIQYLAIEKQLTNPNLIQQITEFQKRLENEICSNIPSALNTTQTDIQFLDYIENLQTTKSTFTDKDMLIELINNLEDPLLKSKYILKINTLLQPSTVIATQIPNKTDSTNLDKTLDKTLDSHNDIEPSISHQPSE